MSPGHIDEGIHQARWRNTTRKGKEYLFAMARLMSPDGVVRSAKVAGELDKNLSGVSKVRDSLINKGIIHAPTIGELAFAVPRFHSFLLSRIEEEGTP